ncbi:hypothetical protein [Ponticoccus litoralis]|uniref:Uncharacterized protein n=1 Tax=Ponticoccus litoralis TaxID=422297 RepID=A0AAW9S5A7_9RHOB
MTAPRPLSAKALREAAQVAREEGVTIVVRNGARVYEFTPDSQTAKSAQAAEGWEAAFE